MYTFVIFLIGAVCGVIGYTSYLGATPSAPLDTTSCTQFSLIDTVACANASIDKAEYISLKHRLESYIESQHSSGTLSTVAVYFRDLEDGPTMGINEYEEYSAASLLKVPSLVTYLKLAEADPSILDQELRVGVADDVAGIQQYPPQKDVAIGDSYSVETLMEYASRYSSNRAVHTLNRSLPELTGNPEILLETYKELGLVPDIVSQEFVLPVKRYASIFRNLYQASYLPPELSHHLLELLTRTTFSKGIVAGVPEGVTVAHKFGERHLFDADTGNNIEQLHDCGIVYYPENPYLLCVMTRGTNYDHLEETIAHISREVYNEVNSRKLPKDPT